MKNRLVTKSYILTVLLLPLMVFTGCSGDEEIKKIPRPVSYTVLKSFNPGESKRVAGTVEAWKRQNIGFEVPGRITYIVEPGTEVTGTFLDDNAKIIQKGTLISNIDDDYYRISFDKSEAELRASQAQYKVAEASNELAKKEYDRYKYLSEKNAASKQDFDRAKAAYDATNAKLISQKAQIKSNEEKLNRAKTNLDNCSLYSPFTGQVSNVFSIPGGYIYPGVPVATVQMMDPIRVQLAVSAKVDQLYNYDDRLRVYVPNMKDPIEGLVYLKDTYADPATRTFLLTLLVRNTLVDSGIPEDLKEKNLPKVNNLWRLERLKENYYCEQNSIFEDKKGHYVWIAENLTVPDLYTNYSPIIKVKKEYIKLGKEQVPFLQLYTFRELTDFGALEPKKTVILGNIDGKIKEGDSVIVSRQRWVLRPGDIVEVALKGANKPTGFYIPEYAIQYDGSAYSVFVAEEESDNLYKVRNIQVKIGVTSAKLRQIIPLNQEDLNEGMKIVIEGAHYLVDNESVNLVEEKGGEQ